MAFWKKSGDPWDVDPEKRKREAVSVFETEPEEEKKAESEGLLSGLFKKKEKEPEEPPIPCPYCGEAMQKGYLTAGQAFVMWSAVKPNPFFGSPLRESITISDEGGLMNYKTCHMCNACRKLIVDVPVPTGPNYVWEGGTVKPPEEEEAHAL